MNLYVFGKVRLTWPCALEGFFCEEFAPKKMLNSILKKIKLQREVFLKVANFTEKV